MDIIREYLEGALLLILVFLVLSHALDFAVVTSALSNAANSSFKTLQARG